MLKNLKTPRVLFPFFMALVMAFMMSGFMVLINVGLVEKFLFLWMRSFLMAFPIAFFVAFFLAPQVHKLVNAICAK